MAYAAPFFIASTAKVLALKLGPFNAKNIERDLMFRVSVEMKGF
jgi:hypothetical protein